MINGFDEIVSSVSPQARHLAEQARTLIQSVYPGVVEVPWPKQRVIGYGVGPKKMSEHFCYISVSKNHINLGFMYGAELPDPEGLLEGEGKLLRHVRITQPEQLSNPALRKLVQVASVHRMPTRPSSSSRSESR
jgi:hypothetical protein